ncbi:MAG: hypothetical protein PHF25_05165 [Candidatus Margulisbacteria bacterium]|nr:hypothetical protein [Candidatus Margulisiibacteriota bacterium]
MSLAQKVLTKEDMVMLNVDKKEVYEMVLKKMQDKISFYNNSIEDESLELIIKDKDVCRVEFVINNSKWTSVDNAKSILGILDGELEYKEFAPVIAKRDFKQNLAGYFNVAA